MSGQEHYRMAEVLLANLRDEMSNGSGVPLRTPEQQTRMIGEATAHALLALTAATVEQTGSRGPGDITAEWSATVWPTGDPA